MVKSGLELILKLTEPLQSCCCPVQKYLPRMAALAWQLSRYLWRGSMNFKINSRPLFTTIFKLKNDNFKTRDFSPLIERVLAGVSPLPLVDKSCLKASTASVFVYDLSALNSAPNHFQLPSWEFACNLKFKITYMSPSNILPGYLLRDSFALHIGHICLQLKVYVYYVYI